MGGAHNGAGAGDAVDATAAADAHAAALTRLLTTRDPAGVEHTADELADAARTDRWTGRARTELIEALVLCLAGDSIQQDADAEDAVCSALEAMGVMTRVGNLVFEFLPEGELAANDLAAVEHYRGWLPAKYVRSGRNAEGRR